LLIRTSRIVVTRIVAMRTFTAQLMDRKPAGLYGWPPPMPFTRSQSAAVVPGDRDR
jgi:hypothetical protein